MLTTTEGQDWLHHAGDPLPRESDGGARRVPTGPRRIVARHERPERVLLERETREAIARGAALVGADPDAEIGSDEQLRGLDDLERAVDAVIVRAVAQLRDGRCRRPRLDAVVRLVVDLEAVRGRLREARVVERLTAFVSVQEHLNKLRAIDDLPTLLRRTPEAICHACGLERGVLSRVDRSEWIIEGAYFDGDEAWSEEFVRLGQNEFTAQLNHLMLETEMVRRHAPSVVHDAQTNPLAHRPLVAHADVRAYVSAPVMPEGRVIGFVHGDHYYSGHDVDTLDRDTIWAFAQGFGHVFERVSLFERLRSQRHEVRRLLASADSALTSLSEQELQFHRTDTGPAGVEQSAAAMFAGPESRLEALLTRRQLEILGLMAGGATNADIADRLVIAEGTVKTHVKHIFRKLRAANRAEAVSRYFRLSIDGGQSRAFDDQ